MKTRKILAATAAALLTLLLIAMMGRAAEAEAPQSGEAYLEELEADPVTSEELRLLWESWEAE